MFDIKKYYTDPLYLNSIAIMLNSVFTAIFGFLFWIIAARTMSSNNIGLAIAIISVSSFIVTLSMFGMDAGLIRFLPSSKNKNNFYSTTLIITLMASFFLAIIFIIGINWFSPSLSFVREGIFPIILIIFIALSSLISIQYTTFIALRRGVLSIVNNLLLGLRIPALYFVSFLGILGVLSAFEVAYFIAFIFSLFVLYHIGIKFKFRLDMESLKASFMFSIGNYTAGISSMAAITIIPIMIVNMIGAENCAYYYMAYSIASVLLMIPGATSTSLFVEGSHNLPLKENVIKALKFIMILLIPSILVIFLIGDKILLIYSKEFSEQSFELLKLFAISSLFSTIISIYITIKNIQKDIKTVNFINLLSTILLIVGGYILLLKYGLIGIGYAWILNNIIISMGLLISIIIKMNKRKFIDY